MWTFIMPVERSKRETNAGPVLAPDNPAVAGQAASKF
jgi:hypothetical protein